MILESDGRFEIILSKEKKGKNWLKLEDETGMVMVRQTFLNRFEEVPAEITIENSNGKKSPDAITPKLIDEGLKNVSSDNYILFSLTKFNFASESKIIGFGFFGKVYITEKINEDMFKKLNKN